MEVMRLGRCLDCDELFGRCFERRPKCGSGNLGSHVWSKVEERMKVGDRVTGKLKRLGLRSRDKLRLTVVEGWLRQADGSMASLVRCIDRDSRHYFDRVVADNGDVLHECDEPLPDHTGHGSARQGGE